MQNFSKLEKNLGFEFKNKELLLQALTHRSYLNEKNSPQTGHNERLEFLGDAVLELAVTEVLYAKFPDKPEGDLTSFRAALVNSKMLSDVSENLEVNNFMLLSRGEAKDTGRARQYILANAFEALVGAMYLDQGYEATADFIKRIILSRIDEVLDKKLYKDPKSLFQEEAQERVGITPTYNVVDEWGPDHDKHFIVGVFLGEEKIAEGEGPSKQEAQAEAAKVAIHTKGWAQQNS